MYSSLKKIIYLVLCIICIAPNIIAQNRKGLVVNTEQKPIANAQILVLNQNKGAVTNVDGSFELDLPDDKYTISIHALGFATQVRKINCFENDCLLDFILSKSITVLDEVTIRSDGMKKNYIQVPISVSVLDAKLLEQTQVWQMDDLSKLVPNLLYGDLGVPYQLQIAIRGISVFSENPATATYIDGVNAINIAGNNLLLTDIDRIEVLRGPQGTRYGRNAMGGVINITTKKPTNKHSGGAILSIGNQGLQRYGAYMRAPMIKGKLFIGGAIQYQKRNGFYFNNLTGQSSFDGNPLEGVYPDGVRMGDLQSIYGHLNLRYIPNTDWKIQFNSKIQTDRSIGASMYYQAVATDEEALGNPYKMRVNEVGSDQRNVFNTSLSVKRFLPITQFVSTTSFSHVAQGYNHIDQDLTAFDVAYGAASYKDQLGKAYPMSNLSQDFQLISTNESLWQWSVGLNGFYQSYDKQFANVYKELGVLFNTEPGTYFYDNLQSNSGYAAFGEISYRATSNLTLTTGLRGDLEYRNTTFNNTFIDTLGNKSTIIEETKKKESYQALSPKLVVSYSINENQTTYLSYNRGFRAGGLNGASSYDAYQSYDPEYSNNFEAGYKLISGDRRFSLTSAAYYIFWKDLQLDIQTPDNNSIWVVENIGNVKSVGLEFESMIKPLKGFQVDFKVGLINAEYQDFDYLGENIKGNKTIFAPDFTSYTAIQYLLPIGKENTNLNFCGEWNGVGKYYFDLHNEIKQEPYNLFNGFISFQYQSINISAFVKNIFNQKYITYAMPGYFKNTLINRPRTFGLTLNYKY